MNREVRIPFKEIEHPGEITDRQAKEFWKHGQFMQRDECTFEDDHDKQERVLKIRSRKTIIVMGGS